MSVPTNTDLIVLSAVRVVNNAYGTTARHTRAAWGDPGTSRCRDDCIPCGIAALRLALVVAGVEGVLGSEQLR
jgi:hypothetical protein